MTKRMFLTPLQNFYSDTQNARPPISECGIVGIAVRGFEQFDYLGKNSMFVHRFVPP